MSIIGTPVRMLKMDIALFIRNGERIWNYPVDRGVPPVDFFLALLYKAVCSGSISGILIINMEPLPGLLEASISPLCITAIL